MTTHPWVEWREREKGKGNTCHECRSGERTSKQSNTSSQKCRGPMRIRDDRPMHVGRSRGMIEKPISPNKSPLREDIVSVTVNKAQLLGAKVQVYCVSFACIQHNITGPVVVTCFYANWHPFSLSLFLVPALPTGIRSIVLFHSIHFVLLCILFAPHHAEPGTQIAQLRSSPGCGSF